MAQGDALINHDYLPTQEVKTRSDAAVADQVSTFSAMGGGVFGVIAGAVLASTVGGHPTAYGTIGAGVGSVFASVVGLTLFRSVRLPRLHK